MLERAKAFLSNRSLAYRRIFLGHGTDTDAVLSDLATFCRAARRRICEAFSPAREAVELQRVLAQLWPTNNEAGR